MRDLEKPPGNARIGATLLDVLIATGDAPGRQRAERALENGNPPRRRRTDWVDPDRIRDAFRAAQAGPQIARRVGHGLVAPQAIGLLLSYTGIATPEKAYRRCDRLLPREQPGDRFEALEIEPGRARIAFHPAHPSPGDVLFCSMRAGMLEAMTPLYGLLPARVRETECAHRGAPACRFELSWRRTPRTGLLLGAGTGAVLGTALGAGLVLWAGLSLPLAALVALLVSLTGASAGRSVDLARQLDALAQGGLGQLALLDQADGVLAEKMDLLAKLDGAGHPPVAERTLGSTPLRSRDPDPSPASVASRLHRPVASLQRAIDELGVAFESALAAASARTVSRKSKKARLKQAGVPASRRSDAKALADVARELLDECRELGRELQAIGVSASTEGEGVRETADLAEIVRRGLASVERHRPAGVEISVEIACDPAPIQCQPFQLEQVVVQLVTNAVQAVRERGGRVQVELSECPEGFELAVSDDGEGIDPEILEDLFDPFFERTAPGDTGLGLTICYRIAKGHGGELSVHSEPGGGTRIAVVLPAKGD